VFESSREALFLLSSIFPVFTHGMFFFFNRIFPIIRQVVFFDPVDSPGFVDFSPLFCSRLRSRDGRVFLFFFCVRYLIRVFVQS